MNFVRWATWMLVCIPLGVWLHPPWWAAISFYVAVICAVDAGMGWVTPGSKDSGPP